MSARIVRCRQEFLRGCIDLGPVWQEIGAAHKRPDLVAVGKALLAEVPSLRADIETAMNRSRINGGIAAGKVVNFSTTESVSVPVVTSDDWELQGGATWWGTWTPQPGPNEANCPVGIRCQDLRTGAPGQTTQATTSYSLQSEGHAIDAITLDFDYVAGYFINETKSAKELPTVELLLLHAGNLSTIKSLWMSEPLNGASYDNFTGKYAHAQARLSGLDLPVPGCARLALRFHNNKHNLQISMMFNGHPNLAVRWASGSEASQHAAGTESCAVAPSSDVCHPYVAGVASCADMSGKAPVSDTRQPYNGRASEPWRSYSGMLYSGQLDEQTVKEIVQYNQHHEKLSHLGVWGGVGGFRNQLMSFTEQGHGYGLLQFNLVDEFLLQLYAEMAHDCTRGSWTCFESRGIPNFTPAGGYTEASQAVVPLHLRWAMVWEDPHSHALSLLRAAPRSWLAESEAVSIANAPTTHGRVSFNASATEAGVTVHAKLVPHAAACIHSKLACSAPMTIQLRRPEAAGKISSVSIGGKRCNACWSDELVTLGAVSATGVTAEVMYSKGGVRIKTDDGAAPKPHVVIAIGGKRRGSLVSLVLSNTRRIRI